MGSRRTSTIAVWPDPDHPPSNVEIAWLEDLIGRGIGDPDIYGYKGEEIIVNDPNNQSATATPF